VTLRPGDDFRGVPVIKAWHAWLLTAAMNVAGFVLILGSVLGGIVTYNSPLWIFALVCPLPALVGAGLYWLSQLRFKIINAWMDDYRAELERSTDGSGA
jgi:hypothetical protein